MNLRVGSVVYVPGEHNRRWRVIEMDGSGLMRIQNAISGHIDRNWRSAHELAQMGYVQELGDQLEAEDGDLEAG